MDRRQRKTRRAIYAAFEDLLLEERYDNVTVARIIERADIGRSTFYAHFATKDELLEQLDTELFASMFDSVDAQTPQPAASQASSLEESIAQLLYQLRDSHRGICGKLLAEGEPHFSADFRQRLSGFLVQHRPERSNWVPEDLMLAFLVGCFCQALSWWHEQGYETSPEELAHWYARALGLKCQTHHTGGNAS